MSSNFERWFYNANGKKDDVTQQPAERKFYDTVGVKINSLKSFISWLILKKHITNLVKVKGEKPMSLISLPAEQKISMLVKNIKNIKDLAVEFNKAFGDVENKKVD
jgi:hypothetical protein